jgi:hypothetical protein
MLVDTTNLKKEDLPKKNTNFVFRHKICLKKAKHIGDTTKVFSFGFWIKRNNGRLQAGILKRFQTLQRIE